MSLAPKPETESQSSEPQVEDVRTVTSNELSKIRRDRARWWFGLFLQPVLAIATLIGILALLGTAQRLGWFSAGDDTAGLTEVVAENVQYICPMVCVAPSTEPGDCPVCGMELQAKKVSGDAKDKYAIRLDQASIRVAGIRTVRAEVRPLNRQLRTIGKISYDEGSLATISAYVDGRIEKLFADYTGVKVDDGDELALLYSPDLYSSQVALLESIKLLKNSPWTNDRISSSNQRLYDSSRQRLIELGLTEEQVNQLEKDSKPDSRIRIVSPMAGTVIEKLANNGQYVKTGQPIYKIADLSKVWLMLELFPQDAARICFGQKVTTKIQSLPGKNFTGRVAFIDPMVDSKTQTVRVRVVIRNEKGLIRVGDFATASIEVSANSPSDQVGAVYDPDLVGKWISPRHPHVISDGPGKCTECGMDLVPASEFGFVSAPVADQNTVVVPRNSVLMAGDSSVVYVETEPGRFEFRNVEIGQIVGSHVSIISGVELGEMVADSAFLLDSAFSMQAKPSLIDPTRAIPREPEIIDEFKTPEVLEALAKLSDSERESANQQKICPVTEKPLGSMGKPISIVVNSKSVWICCSGCEEKVRGNPDKFFAVLKKAAAVEDEKAKKIAEAMAGLSAEDRVLAEAQVFCPVINYRLGSMGTPIRVEIEGGPVFICCKGCREKLENNPKKYLAILANGPPPAETKTAPVGLPEIRPYVAPSDSASIPESEQASDALTSEEAKDIAEAIANLSIADQKIAKWQKNCPVMDFPLGSMGTPVKVEVDGTAVFLCCENCRKSLLKSPAKYLAKLPKKVAQ